MATRSLPLCFEPVFKPHVQNLCFYKGADFTFSLLVADYPIDFRGASFAMEVRPPNGDVRQITNVLGSTVAGTSIIKLEFEKLDCSNECKADRDIKKLASLPISEGDFISLEGSGINLFKILSVTATSVLVEGLATRDVSKGRVFFRYKSWTSFTVLPSFTPTFIAVESTALIGAETILVQSLPRKFLKGDTLVFSDGTSDTLVAVLNEDAPLAARSLTVQPLAAEIAANSIANIDAFPVILTDASLAGMNQLVVPATPAAIPVGTTLHFSRRTDQGWEYLTAVDVTDTAPKGSVEISITPVDIEELPIGAIAFFGSVAFNTLTIGITADDTRGLYLKEYSYDLIVRLADGEKIPIMKGNINFDGYVSDFI
jgi:hypothetical protein